MDKLFIDKIERIVIDRKVGYSNLTNASDLFKKFNEFDQEVYKDRSLKRKYKELIGLGSSISNNCEPCMEWHISQALKFGATRDQIIEGIEVGLEIGGGSATVACRFALMVLDYYTIYKSVDSE